jgi:hypothetical protein
MAFRFTPLTLLVGAGAALGLYVFLKKPATVGEMVKHGDEVLVPVASLPPGSLPTALPQGAGLVGIRVDQVASGYVYGPIVSYVLQTIPQIMRVALPAPIGPVRVSLASATNIIRDSVEVK